MTNSPLSSPQDTVTLQAERDALLAEFVVTNAAYYRRVFAYIGSRSSFAWTFNLWAFLLGPIWYGCRSVWNWGLAFLLLETFGWVQIVRGAFGDLAADAWLRIAQIEGTLALRKKQLQAALDKGSEKAAVYQRAVDSLEQNIGSIRLEAQQIEDSGLAIVIFGIAFLLVVKALEGVMANVVLEKRFFAWLSDASLSYGMRPSHIALSLCFTGIIFATTITHYAFPTAFAILSDFPTRPFIRLGAIGWVEWFFNAAVANGEAVFDFITRGIRIVLDFLELLFVHTPWVVIISFIVLLTGLAAGVRTAIWSAAFLGYMGVLGFWEKAMTTLALLGTAACLSILIGIPLGMFCARRPRFYAVIRPIMDFMQTMPAFVFMIPVIAFFGTGKPAAVVTTMIFGGTPVVRLTVLGLRGVPESVREAALSYGANKWYLLTKVDLPLASPSIRAGINQTIMLSLAMVVVASLIGAKGLGEDVLEALQYANVGQGILAGFAILFCAMILDRIVQGGKQ
jgi:glycine betaine/proline transport system permease protein